MPRDLISEPSQRTSVRSAVLDLIARAGGARPEEAEYLDELRAVVADGRSRAADLWEMYRGRGSRHAAAFGRYCE
jgi:hypothetical protein